MGELNGILENPLMEKKKSEETLSEEFERKEHLSRGNTLASAYLKNKVADILTEIALFDPGVRVYVTRGILETLIRNVLIPRDYKTEQFSKQAINGILVLKGSQIAVKKLLDEIESLFEDYEKALQQAYTQLKQEFEIKLDETRKVLEQQLCAKAKFEVERQSRFREKWRKMRTELNTYYEKLLENYRQRLLNEV